MANDKHELVVKTNMDNLSPHAVGLNSSFMEKSDIQIGNRLVVKGRDYTSAEAQRADADISEDEICLGSLVEKNLKAKNRDVITVEKRQPKDADLVVFNKSTEGRNEETEEQLKRLFRHRVVTTGDLVRSDGDESSAGTRLEGSTNEQIEVTVRQVDSASPLELGDIAWSLTPQKITDDTRVLLREKPSDKVQQLLSEEANDIFRLSLERRVQMEDAALRLTEQNAVILGITFAGLTLWADLRSGGGGGTLLSAFEHPVMLVAGLLSILGSIAYSFVTFADYHYKLRIGWPFEKKSRAGGLDWETTRRALNSGNEIPEIEARLLEGKMKWSKFNTKYNNNMKKRLIYCQTLLVLGLSLIAVALFWQFLNDSGAL
ncbi:hypothetical protein [Haloprofundus salilacus]|uniref:hypothetical protein n=1 Tax=Haloprofundus salilacus TaxID=2876190 RepID=UPI001CD03190|nr:hypothetical protein [Haloprofundus salilacus]